MIALLVGLMVGVFAPGSWRVITQILAGWNTAVWLYLLQMAWVMRGSSRSRAREIAEREDNNAVVVLALLSIGASLSLVAIVFELAAAKGAAPSLQVAHYIFTAVTVLGSWLLVGVTYTFHYARIFYRSSEKHRALRFPEGELHPNYWDFLYFSFTIAVAAQTSDVTIMSAPMRKAVLAQSLLSFIFNAAIIGMSINIAAGLVGS
ncbi:MAG: DUF1345 domain-containing protein [Pseudomonadota bacterium]|nr:DUF1345 domain-containing protein [Pseudomonadota bacterium]